MPRKSRKPKAAGGNTVSLTDRLPQIPTEREAEIAADVEEFKEQSSRFEDFDPSNLQHRARAINGALSKFGFVSLTGREYWRVYGEVPGRDTFFSWVEKAKATIDDIYNEYDNLR